MFFFQVGAGIVSNSKKKNELEEVNNKLMALFKSVKIAYFISISL